MKIEMDIDLFGLAIIHLKNTRAYFTGLDVIDVMNQIIDWSEQKNRYCKHNKIKFYKDHISVDEKYIK